MARLERRILVSLACCLAALPASAEEKFTPKIEEEPIAVGWDDFPPKNFPAPRLGSPPPRTPKAMEATKKRFDEKRAPHIRKLVGGSFVGLGEVVWVKPSKDDKTKHEVVIAQRDDEHDQAEWRSTPGGRMIRRTACWLVEPREAVLIKRGMLYNVTGTVEGIDVVDWVDGPAADNTAFHYKLKDVEAVLMAL